jgi:hypothetical protein
VATLVAALPAVLTPPVPDTVAAMPSLVTVPA